MISDNPKPATLSLGIAKGSPFLTGGGAIYCSSCVMEDLGFET